jgi:hypothetical protein
MQMEHGLHGLEVTVLIGMSVLVGVLVAPRFRVQTPLVLLILGLLLGFVPELRQIELPPETVLLLFLPSCSSGRASRRLCERSAVTFVASSS